MEENSQGSDVANDSRVGFVISQPVILWGVAAFVVAVVMCTFNNSALVLRAGFFTKTFAVFLGAILGLGGALIGDALRKFARPDRFYTSGGFFQIIWIKVFWLCGPQIIGLLAGVAIGCSIVLK